MTHDQAVVLAAVLMAPKSGWESWQVGLFLHNVRKPEQGFGSREQLVLRVLPVLNELLEAGKIERRGMRWHPARRK